MSKKAIRTDIQAKNAGADGQEGLFAVEGCKGLFLRVRSAGGKAWTYRFSLTEKALGGEVRYVTKSLSLGRYPDTSLAEAKQAYYDAAKQTQKARLEGAEDPVAARKATAARASARRAAERSELTVSDLFSLWGGRLTRAPKGSKRTVRKDGGAELFRIMERDVLPYIGAMKAKDLTRADVQLLCERKQNGAAPRTFIQGRILSYLRQMYDWAIETNKPSITANPTTGVRKRSIGVVNAVRKRALLFSEISELRAKLPLCGLHESSQAAIALFLATGMRLGELVSAKWTYISEAEGVLTLPDTKNDEPHTVPLSLFAWEQLAVMRKYSTGPYLLDGRKLDPETGRPGMRDKRQFASSIGERVSTDPQKGRPAAHLGSLALSGGHWTVHDLRRSAATRMQELGVLPHVIERCLNHAPQGLQSIYQHFPYEVAKREAFERLGAALSDIWHQGQSKIVGISHSRKA